MRRHNPNAADAASCPRCHRCAVCDRRGATGQLALRRISSLRPVPRRPQRDYCSRPEKEASQAKIRQLLLRHLWKRSFTTAKLRAIALRDQTLGLGVGNPFQTSPMFVIEEVFFTRLYLESELSQRVLMLMPDKRWHPKDRTLLEDIAPAILRAEFFKKLLGALAMISAGLPATIERAGTSRLTTLPIPMMAPSPIRHAGMNHHPRSNPDVVTNMHWFDLANLVERKLIRADEPMLGRENHALPGHDRMMAQMKPSNGINDTPISDRRVVANVTALGRDDQDTLVDPRGFCPKQEARSWDLRSSCTGSIDIRRADSYRAGTTQGSDSVRF